MTRLRRIKNHQKLTTKDLIITLLKSENSAAEQNLKKRFNNNTNDDVYDDKISGKISDIRMIPSRLENIVDINDRNKIKRELYEIEKRKTFKIGKKKEIYNLLVELANTINKNETYQYYDRDDLNYYKIRDRKFI